MNRGTQIAYIPTHAEGNLQHPDVEFGFVTSQRFGAHFCRYQFRAAVRFWTAVKSGYRQADFWHFV